MKSVADYVVDFLAKQGIHDIFLVAGGGCIYLLDAVGRNKKIRYLPMQHEQAAATAAEAYARVRNRLSACLVTTGPGGTNALTGVAGAWVDSIPVLVVSGQVKREIMANHKKLRQLGPQEINIVEIVTPITKFAMTVRDPLQIRVALEQAVYEATSKRPGPVWLDIPLDVQASTIDETNLKSFIAPLKSKHDDGLGPMVRQVLKLLREAKRPLLICGNGIRLAQAEKLLPELLHKLNLPVVLHLNGLDLIPAAEPLLVGQFGPGGTRRGNFALQNADLILSIGSSLNVAATGFNFADFGRHAKKIMVNIDPGELNKPTIKVDMPICVDAKDFIEELLVQLKNSKLDVPQNWHEVCDSWKKKYPSIISDFYHDKQHVNSYLFMDKLSDLLTANDFLTTGIGLDTVSFYQAFRVKKGQCAFVNENFGQMGWCLPAAIGACVGNHHRRHVCVTGDGSLQLNVQELATIRAKQLPIKIFIFNNHGYWSIRTTQDNLFNGRHFGSDPGSGLINPDFRLLAKAYGLSYGYIADNSQISKKIKAALKTSGPTLYEVNVADNQPRIPKSTTYRSVDGKLISSLLDDMWPFLPREELHRNMSLFNKKK